MQHLDVLLTQAINELSHYIGAMDFFMIWVSKISIPLLVLAVAAQWWRQTDRTHVRHVFIATGLSFIVSLVINQLILIFIQRARPYDAGITDLLIDRSGDFSFPSDHATASFAIAAALIMHGMRRMGAWFLGAALLVAFSRVYIGTHYFSDVAGGALIGVVAAVIVQKSYREGTRLDRFLTAIL